MRQLVFEIPLSVTESDFPIDLLRHSQILHMLKFDSSGYLFICRMPTNEWEAYNTKFLRSVKGSRSSNKISVKLLERISGAVLLRVAGEWFERGKTMNPRQLKELEFFRAMERSPFYALGTPVISENAIRFSVVTEADKINRLLEGLKQLNIPYKVDKLGRLAGGSETLLGGLTVQQSRVLRLAHTMGYYEIPRRTNTEDLAKVLGMDKATVGEHLRRAEKNVFDKLIIES
ncbi:MAG TPA: helix-turn-helix domain-containing protein [Nitrososphaerales archaeon]|nr:helix-turn-helix domain-containing protein [Nitrososphaerales archaeon]